MNQIPSNYKQSPQQSLSTGQINQVRVFLNNKPRDLLLFELSIQTGVPVKRLLALKVKDLIGMDVGDRIAIDKVREETPYYIIMTKSLNEVWRNYIQSVAVSEDDYIFKSRKGAKPLNLSTVSNMVNEWFAILKLNELSGVRSLRKTWERHYRNSMESIYHLKGASNSIKALRPVKIATVQEIVHDRLFDAILSGRIPPGQRLKIQDIATQMNVSRVPVREAFLRLQAGGFISPLKKSAAIVMELSRENLEETLKIRLAIETMAARKAAINCTDQAVQHLEALQTKYGIAINSNDVNKILKVNKKFHYALYREANMPILVEMIGSLWNRIIPYFNILLRIIKETGNPLSQESFEFHKAMLNGMRNRDPNEVSKWLEVDLTEAYRIVTNFFDRLKAS